MWKFIYLTNLHNIDSYLYTISYSSLIVGKRNLFNKLFHKFVELVFYLFFIVLDLISFSIIVINRTKFKQKLCCITVEIYEPKKLHKNFSLGFCILSEALDIYIYAWSNPTLTINTIVSCFILHETSENYSAHVFWLYWRNFLFFAVNFPFLLFF